MAFSQDIISIETFTDLKQQIGPTKTGNLYEHKETGKKYILKNKKVEHGGWLSAQKTH